jgi:tetratricopeptide (TPR) repeat protein
LKQALLSKLPAAILRAEPVDAADFAEWAAAWAEPVEQQILLALMTRLVESALTGEPDEDRGLYSTLADLYERTGDPDRAMDVLWDGVTNYPEEFTWHHALAGHLFHQGDLDSALDSAESAVTYSYGDNRLRAVERQALILIQLGRADEARSLAQTTLETQPAPREGLEVRTWRYRESLQEIAASGEAE